MVDWTLSEIALLNTWPMIEKVWLGIVCVGCLVVSYRVDKRKKRAYRTVRTCFVVGSLVRLLVQIESQVSESNSRPPMTPLPNVPGAKNRRPRCRRWPFQGKREIPNCVMVFVLFLL